MQEIFPLCSFGEKTKKKINNKFLAVDVAPLLKGGTRIFVLQKGKK